MKTNTVSLSSEIYKTYLYPAIHDERKRIAEKLHDKIGGLLCTAKMYLNLVGNSPAKNQSVYSNVTSLIDAAVNELRDMAKNLDEGNEQLQLLPAITGLCKLMNASGETHYNPILPDYFTFENEQISNELFLIIREILLNVQKHAHALECKIVIRQLNHILKVIITDDGDGFQNKSNKTGIGLQLVRNRIQKLNGMIEIHSLPGKGTYVYIAVNHK